MNAKGYLIVALYAGTISDATLIVATDDPKLVEIVEKWFDSNKELECIVDERQEDARTGRKSDGDGTKADDGELTPRKIALLRLTNWKPEPT